MVLPHLAAVADARTDDGSGTNGGGQQQEGEFTARIRITLRTVEGVEVWMQADGERGQS